MLRTIYQKGRRRQQTSSERESGSKDGTDNSETFEVASEQVDEELEPWHEWIKRVTREIEEAQHKFKIEDW
eukprot:10173609-Karenia_brevis.AAC.1